MIGKLDKEIIEKFIEFQEKTGKHRELYIEDVEFEVKKVENIFDIVRRGASPRPIKNFIVDKSHPAKKYNWLKISDVTSSNIYLRKTSQYINEDGKNKSVFGKKGDFLVTNSMTVGVPIILDIDTCFHDGFLYLGFKNRKQKNFYNLYLYYFFTSFRERLILKSKDGIVKNLNTDIMREVQIPIPKDLNKFYSSYQIQEAIVEFLEYSFENIERIRQRIDERYSIFERLKKALIPSTFIKDYVKIAFGRYAKEKGIGFSITDVEFEIKRIHSDTKDDPNVICKKRMGFTPKTSSSGDINWFSVKDLGEVDGLYISKPNSRKKTTIELIKQSVDKNNTGKSEKLIPIKKGDILVSFKLTVGVVKIYNSTEPLYCNEAIDILTVDEAVVDNRYVAYNCMLEYPKYGTKTNNGITLNDDDKKEIKIFIPKDLKYYTSLEIQKIMADFIEYTENRLQKEFDRMDTAFHNLDRLYNTYLGRTFRLIDWGGKS